MLNLPTQLMTTRIIGRSNLEVSGKLALMKLAPLNLLHFKVGDLEHARVHPKFLHSNATSHKWAFGAIAELLDNAVDEMQSGATFVKVDRIYNAKDNSPALLFQDDGGGMNPEGIRKCMSLGYSSKTSNTTIGQYGNGFKTSTMRLGADVIVFSRAMKSGRATQSVGLLSYTFLRRTWQDDVIVPMVDFDISDHWAEPIIYSSKDDWSSNLNIMLQWSPFASKDEIMLQFENIGSHGTKIIIYNLWLNDEGIYELNFDDDDEDIRLRDEANRGNPSKTLKRVLELQSHISYRIRFSLRAYASVLYLRKFTNFQIILRGNPVQQLYIADDLKYSKAITYRPTVGLSSKEVVVETTIGFIKEAPALRVCGFNVYHKNRLIRPFWKVTGDGSNKGHGVVGVLEANFIEPAHDKQDFERSSLFSKLEMRLKQMVMEYWKGHCHLIGHQPDGMSKSNLQKQYIVQPRDGSIMQKQSVTDSHMHPVQPLIDLADDLHHQLPGQQTRSTRTSVSGKLPNITWPVAGSAREASLDGLNSRSIDQISEENIQLINRCQEHIQKEVELEKTIEELENELEESRKKCARLSSHLESQRMQMLTGQRS
ncbi:MICRORCHIDIA 2-like [Olea europaea subsp. europaea]|uniref:MICRORCHIDIA 2-like n=1 Tax=Olea europaea subsp. europaea TaxID=158383 RepID=A0A8S0PX91_OLEEU|nr:MICRORCHIDIA 2-like [Olea europaea subsp. europaea]